MIKRPSTLDEGVTQMQLAVEQTTPRDALTSTTPRARLWRCVRVLCSMDAKHDGVDFVGGMRLLYNANAVVSCLYNTLVPCIEERLRHSTLQDEYDRASAHRDGSSLAQNSARFRGLLAVLAEAEGRSRVKEVDEAFATMRESMRLLHHNAVVADGLEVLYVSSKTARAAFDLMFKRLVDAFENDITIRTTADIPLEAMMIR